MPSETAWIDLEIVIQNEENQMQKDKYYITYIWNQLKKRVQMNLFTKQKLSDGYRKQNKQTKIMVTRR